MTTKNNIPSGYKDSAVGIIPQEWEVKRLGLVCNFLDNQRVPIKDMDRLGMHGPYPYYGASGIIDYVNDYIFDDELILLGEDGANIINRSTPLAFMVEGKIWVNNYAHILRPIEPNNRFYICSYLESISYDKYNTGTAQPKLNREGCEKILIPGPPMEEQRKIAEILGVWDEAIEKQSRLIERLEVRKRALMQRLLTGRVRLPNFVTPWQKIKLGEICKRVIRRNEENCQNVMTISAQRGFVSQTDFFNKSVASSTLDNYYLVHKDEFCYNKSYSNGYPMGAIKRLKETEKAVVTTLYICFSIADCKRLDINFFEQYCEFGGLNRGLTKVANEGGRAHGLLNVTPSDFFGLQLLLPSLSEQKAIAEVLTVADNEIATHRKKLETLCLQKRGLMQQLLTGKTRVKI